MILELVAELLAGETLASNGGPIDSLTAAAADVELWGYWRPSADDLTDVELAGAPVPTEVGVA